MTVQDLIDILSEMNPDSQVRFASQPNWPFEYSINDVVEVSNNEDDEDNEDTTVYLVEGRQLGYLPGNVKDEIGW